MNHLQGSIGKLAFKIFGAAPLLKYRPNNPLILMYHGVTEDRRAKTNRHTKHVYFEDFRKQLRVIKRHFKVVSITDLVNGLISDENMERCVCITFDDGFYNNYSLAAPILADHCLPASFYLSTGYIGETRWMWTDLLESTIARTTHTSFIVPQLAIGLSLETLNLKQKAIYDIKKRLKTLSRDKSETIVSELRTQLDVDDRPPYGDYAFMNWEHAKELERSGFEIGAHSVNHPILSRIDEENAELEIVQSALEVKRNIGKCADVFCYPNGKKDDYNRKVIDVCHRHYKAALSANIGYAAASDLYELRRIGVSGGLRSENLLWWMTRYSLAA